MLEAAAKLFPKSTRAARGCHLEHVLPAATPADVAGLEQELRLSLPRRPGR